MSGDFEQAKSRVCQSEGAYVSVRPLASSWEQRKLGNCGTTYGGLSGKTKEDFGHGNARFVPYTNVFDNPLTDTKRLETVEIDSSQNKVAYGDTFFTVSSETPDEVGMSSVWLSDQDDVYLNSFCFGYRQDSTFDPYYLAYMLRSSSIRAYCAVFATPFHAPLLQRSMADCHVAMRVALIARGAQAPLLANTAGYALSRCACALTRRLQYG